MSDEFTLSIENKNEARYARIGQNKIEVLKACFHRMLCNVQDQIFIGSAEYIYMPESHISRKCTHIAVMRFVSHKFHYRLLPSSIFSLN